MTRQSWHQHHHRRHRQRSFDLALRRALWHNEGDELAALEEYQRDVEQHLADVSERIKRLQAAKTAS